MRRSRTRGIATAEPIASWYAGNTAGGGRDHRRWAQVVADPVALGGKVLEVARPRFLALEIAKLGDFAICRAAFKNFADPIEAAA